MQYNNTTDKNGIIQREEFLCGLGDGGISGDSTLLKQFTALNNESYWEVFMAILTVDKRWKADDFNYTDYPEAPITMVASQRDYELPVAVTGANLATLLRVNRVWVLDAQGNRQELSRMEEGDDFDYTTTGQPSRYRLHGKSIYLDVRPNSTSVTLTNGLIIQFQRIPDAFTSADTTQQPGFMATYHDLIPIRSSAKFMMRSDPKVAAQLNQEFYERLGIKPTLAGAIADMDDNASMQMTLANPGSGR